MMPFGFFQRWFGKGAQASSFPELEKILGYRFQDEAHLFLALSHRSYVNSRKAGEKPASNERLEFLGDSVLNMVVTDFLYQQHPDREEGWMSKMKSLVVSSKVLGLCAQQWRLGDFVLLSRSEEKSGGRQRPSILADAYEAVVGAVYLDGGVEAARKLIHDSLMTIMYDVLGDEDLANYKSRLLEYTQSRGLGAPAYDVLQVSGPEHRKIFTVGVFVQNREWGRGRGDSKKSAEQAGAREAMEGRENSGGENRPPDDEEFAGDDRGGNP